MLEAGMTMLHLDARGEAVDVPSNLRDDHHLRLNFSYKFELNTFEIGDEGVVADLSFQGSTYLCAVPWSAVFGMTSHVTGETRIWAEEMPAELLMQAAALAEAARQEEPAAVDETAVDPDEEDEEEDLGGAVRRVGHLRIIK